jgi:uncharacterized protein YndB with AHSA1/START domain
MNPTSKILITVQATINAPIDHVWSVWTQPGHIVKWNNASPDWHTPKATNDLRTGGKFVFTMAARDGSVSFDFEGIYTNVKLNQLIEYTMADGRVAKIQFSDNGESTNITESFEAETENTEELQRGGWQAILNNFKQYAESIL